MKIAICLNEVGWDVTKELEAVQAWFGDRIELDPEIFLVKLGTPKWNKRSINTVWINKHLQNYFRGHDLVVLNLRPDQWKREGSAGYAANATFYDKKFIAMRSTEEGKRSKNIGWMDNNEFAGRLRHEIIHILYDLTGQKDRLHELEKAGRIDDVLDDIDFSVFKPVIESKKNSMAKNKCEGVVIHHTVTPNDLPISKSTARINAGHRTRNFPLSKKGYYVGYHYLIAKNGEIKQTRYDEEVGAHSPDDRGNFRFIGLSLIGNFNNDKLEGSQYQSLVLLIKKLAKKYGWTAEDIHYHQQFKPTACPGKNVISQIEQIKEDVFNPQPMISPWAKEASEWVVENKLIQNWDEPKEPISREALAVILHRYSNLIKNEKMVQKSDSVD